jgi:hypothetical protein
MSDEQSPSVTTIINRIGVSALAQALGHKNLSTVHSWKTRGRIPYGNWDGILRVAREKHIDEIDLAALAAANGISTGAAA